MESTRPVPNLRSQFFPVKCVQNKNQGFHGVHIFFEIYIGKGRSLKECFSDILEDDRIEAAPSVSMVSCEIEIIQPQYLYSPYIKKDIKTNLYP